MSWGHLGTKRASEDDYTVASMCYIVQTQTGTRLSRKIQNIALFIHEKSMVLGQKNHLHGTLSTSHIFHQAGALTAFLHFFK